MLSAKPKVCRWKASTFRRHVCFVCFGPQGFVGGPFDCWGGGGGGGARTIFPEWNGAFRFDHFYKMFILNRVIEQHMENFINFKPEFENWAKKKAPQGSGTFAILNLVKKCTFWENLKLVFWRCNGFWYQYAKATKPNTWVTVTGTTHKQILGFIFCGRNKVT